MPVCLLLAGAVVATLPTEAFALLWTHSVEQTEWREDWSVVGGRLALVEASVAGSGAGMQPADDARLGDGAWHWRPHLEPQPRLVLANSAHGADYRLCWEKACRPLSTLLPQGAGGPAEVAPCHQQARGVVGGGEEKMQ
jgi:hypothetical protein